MVRPQLIGRDREVAQLTTLLAQPTRLVTLVGTAGVGKSTLAHAVASGLSGRRAVAVALAEVTGATDVPAAVATAFGLPDLPVDHVLAAIAESARDAVLLLDNLEHLGSIGEWIVSLLAAAPELTVLATSRSALGVRPERAFTVKPLDASDASLLLRLRAAEQAPQFDEVTAMAIAAAMDHLPLALELAAARLRVLTPAELLARLQTGTAVIGIGLEASLRASLDLLTPDAAVLFRRLAVFAAAPSLDAIETVCVRPVGLPALRVDPLDALSELIGASLLHRADRGDESRFTSLRVVHEFAASLLRESGEGPALVLAHAEWARASARAHRALLGGADQAEGLSRFDADFVDFAAAIRWSIENETGGATAGELINLMRMHWHMRGRMHTGGAFAETLLHRDGLTPMITAAACAAAGDAARARGDWSAAARWAQRMLTAAEDVEGNPGLLAEALTGVAITARHLGDFDTAIAMTERVIDAVAPMNSPRTSAAARTNLASVFADTGQTAKARSILDEIFSSGVPLTAYDRVINLELLASIHLADGDFDEAAQVAAAGIAEAETLGDPTGVATMTNLRSKAARYLGDANGALADAERALALANEAGLNEARANALYNRGCALALIGPPARALHALADAARSAGDDPVGLNLRELLVDLAATGVGLLPDEAVATALALRDERIPSRPTDYARDLAQRTVEARLGPRRAATVRRAATDMDDLQLLDLMLRSVDAVPIDATPHDRGGLTRRELEVLRLIASGLTDKEIACELACAPRTVSTHVSHILTKLEAPTRTAAVARGIELDLL